MAPLRVTVTCRHAEGHNGRHGPFVRLAIRLVIGQIDVRPGVFVHPAWWKSLTLGLPTCGLSLALSRRHEAPNRGARRGACPESRRHSVSSALRKARPPP